MMLARIIFLTAVSAATIVVILLALVSPSANRKPQKNQSKWQTISLYMQQPDLPDQNPDSTPQLVSALIYHHMLTEGPENFSRVIGKAQGFIVPIEHFAHSAFNIVYLSFDTPDYTGSLSVDAKQLRWHGVKEELIVVGGTGSFAFARGLAVFTQMGNQNAKYHVKLRLRFPTI